ncbi:MAG: hypothetical protein ACTH2U_09540 [Brevibacterium sp.]
MRETAYCLAKAASRSLLPGAWVPLMMSWRIFAPTLTLLEVAELPEVVEEVAAAAPVAETPV